MSRSFLRHALGPGSIRPARPLGLTLCLTLLLTCGLGLTAHAQAVQLVNAFPTLTFFRPTDIQHAGDDRLFIVQLNGEVQVVSAAGTEKSRFLDLTDRVTWGGELGLLGLAFHPHYAANGFFYVNYTTGVLAQGTLKSVVSRFSVTADPGVADPGSELMLLTLPQTTTIHKGGQLRFGPDGYLYIAFGEGGIGNHAKDRTNLFGSILRIDVDTPAPGLDYGIPPDNPYAGNTDGFREEIYAHGLRNPWRFAFDAQGRLWAGDVGWQNREELNWVTSGGNYGWNTLEGTRCMVDGCNPAGLEAPILEYEHAAAAPNAVIAGAVYQGTGCAALAEQFIYGDWGTGDIWALQYDDSGATGATLLSASLPFLSSFGADHAGELHLVHANETAAVYSLGCAPLPVELVAFEARSQDRRVVLTWHTASETGNAGFEVQHALKEGPFVTLGFVPGAGTTLAPQAYTYRTAPLHPGTHRFRLKQTDYDGSLAFSAEAAVYLGVPDAYVLSASYPNPFHSATTFSLTTSQTQHVRVEVTDLLGKRVALLHDGLLEGGEPHRFTFDAGALPSGIYFYQATGDHFSAATRKALLVR